MPAWIEVQYDRNRSTTRLQIAEGALYCVVERGDMGGIAHEHVVFAPKPIEPLHSVSPVKKAQPPREASSKHRTSRSVARLTRDQLLVIMDARRRALDEVQDALNRMRPDEDGDRGFLEATLDEESLTLAYLACLLQRHLQWADEPEAEFRAILGEAVLVAEIGEGAA